MIRLLGINFHLYGLILGLAIVIAYEISSRSAKDRHIDPKILDKLFWVTVLSGVIGARAYHVVDLWDSYYSFYPERMIYLWEGGLAIWGAVAGGAIGLWVGKWIYGQTIKFLELMDVAVVGLPLAQAIGRLGNWVNGELYGRSGEPLFAYEGILNVGLFLVLRLVAKRKTTGQTSGVYLVGYGLIRAALENLREEEVIWRIGGLPTAVIFSLIAVMIGVFLILRKRS